MWFSDLTQPHFLIITVLPASLACAHFRTGPRPCPPLAPISNILFVHYIPATLAFSLSFKHSSLFFSFCQGEDALFLIFMWLLVVQVSA